MTLRLTCKRCDEVITGEDEDQLAAAVEAHVRSHPRTGGGVSHTVSRAQVLGRLRRQGGEKSPDPA